ncbi:MAG: hypothetical protein QOE45_2147 [Frankiaceae bacterium]|jgi:uncharacterized protein (TIGR03086 family)|nr:hypothetical protein [Frankiaceae bacterium]
MSDPALLEAVLAKDAALIEGVAAGQWALPTPCTEYDVRTLVNHIVGWLEVFAAGANQRAHDGNADGFTTDDPAGDFTAAAADLVAGWRSVPADRPVKVATTDVPQDSAFAMTLMEYVTHGCDLALATGQPVPFADDELETTLAAARTTLPPQYRGPGKAFGDEVTVPHDAPPLDRLLGFMGRAPRA